MTIDVALSVGWRCIGDHSSPRTASGPGLSSSSAAASASASAASASTAPASAAFAYASFTSAACAVMRALRWNFLIPPISSSISTNSLAVTGDSGMKVGPVSQW